MLEISNAGELYWFAEQVNQGNTDLNAVLTKDIALQDGGLLAAILAAEETTEIPYRVWEPIGWYLDTDEDGVREDCCYEGIFDGNGHSISGLYCVQADGVKVGMFAQLNGAEVRNLTIADSYVQGKNCVGMVCGYANDSIIDNCTFDGIVQGVKQVGGICGYLNGGSISACNGMNTVSGDQNVGGICGIAINGSVMESSYNGTVSGQQFTGGISGRMLIGAIEKCIVEGTVSGQKSVGGICGELVGGTATASYAIADITGDTQVGGVCGL